MNNLLESVSKLTRKCTLTSKWLGGTQPPRITKMSPTKTTSRCQPSKSQSSVRIPWCSYSTCRVRQHPTRSPCHFSASKNVEMLLSNKTSAWRVLMQNRSQFKTSTKLSTLMQRSPQLRNKCQDLSTQWSCWGQGWISWLRQLNHRQRWEPTTILCVDWTK